MSDSPRVAIVGAGIFGCTSAIRLASNSYDCVLFEVKSDIMKAASRVNQYRFHKGYHYPRSLSTVKQLQASSQAFSDEYKEALNRNYKHLYSVAAEHSQVDKNQYLEFLENAGLTYKVLESHPSINKNNSDLIIEADEYLIDYAHLKNTVLKRLNENDIDLRLNTEFNRNMIDEFDIIVNCSYGFSSNILPPSLIREYKYQLLKEGT